MCICIAFGYIYIHICFLIFYDWCYVLELSLFQIFSYIFHIVGISFMYVEQISFYHFSMDICFRRANQQGWSLNICAWSGALIPFFYPTPFFLSVFFPHFSHSAVRGQQEFDFSILGEARGIQLWIIYDCYLVTSSWAIIKSHELYCTR